MLTFLFCLLSLTDAVSVSNTPRWVHNNYESSSKVNGESHLVNQPSSTHVSEGHWLTALSKGEIKNTGGRGKAALSQAGNSENGRWWVNSTGTGNEKIGPAGNGHVVHDEVVTTGSADNFLKTWAFRNKTGMETESNFDVGGSLATSNNNASYSHYGGRAENIGQSNSNGNMLSTNKFSKQGENYTDPLSGYTSFYTEMADPKDWRGRGPGNLGNGKLEKDGNAVDSIENVGSTNLGTH